MTRQGYPVKPALPGEGSDGTKSLTSGGMVRLVMRAIPPYRKAIGAAVLSTLTALQALYPLASWLTVLTALLTPVLVYRLPNVPRKSVSRQGMGDGAGLPRRCGGPAASAAEAPPNLA